MLKLQKYCKIPEAAKRDLDSTLLGHKNIYISKKLSIYPTACISSLSGLSALVTSFAQHFKRFAEQNFGLKTEEQQTQYETKYSFIYI